MGRRHSPPQRGAARVRRQREAWKTPRPERRPNEQRVSWLVGLVLDILVSQGKDVNAEGVNRLLGMLREQLGSAEEVAARLVSARGPKVRFLLRDHRELPEVSPLFAHRSVDPTPSLAETLALVKGQGVNVAAVGLARAHGLAVFDRLNRYAGCAQVRALLGLRPRRQPGRPSGRVTRDLQAWVIAEMHDQFGIKRAALLKALGRNPAAAIGPGDSRHAPPDYQWFRYGLRRGRQLRRLPLSAQRTSSQWPSIVFLRRYSHGLPPRERLRVLCGHLIGAMTKEHRERVLRAEIAQQVGKRLKRMLPQLPRPMVEQLRTNGPSARWILEQCAAAAPDCLAEHVFQRLSRHLPPPRG